VVDVEERKAKEIRKSVKIGNTVYDVAVDGKSIIAGETHYPLPGYGNCYGTEYKIEITNSKRWARKEIYCFNNTYATRGHGMTDGWTDYEGFMKRKEAEKLIAEVKKKLEQAEGGTPDVREVFDIVVSQFQDIEEE